MAIHEAGKGPLQHYFWVKIMKKEQYEKSLKDDILRGADGQGVIKPMRPGVIDSEETIALMRSTAKAVSVNIGFVLDAKALEAAGLMVDVRDFQTGYSREQIEKWTRETEEGRKWSSNGLCVLFHVAIEQRGAM
jgi:hypothetical protein